MDARVVFGLLAGALDFCAYIPYFYSVVRGENKPNKASWIIWASVKVFIVISCFSGGARNTLWLPLVQMIGNGTIAIMAVKYGIGGWTKLDRTCIILAFLSVPLIVLKMPMVALIAVMFAELLGTIPTLNKLCTTNEKESLNAWILIFTACVFSVMSLEKWEFLLTLYPIYVLAINGLILTLVILNLRRRE